MAGDLAVVLDVAGTMLRMYRVAKDLSRGCLMKGVVTWDLIMEKRGRALVVPHIDPAELAAFSPETPVKALVNGRENSIGVSCSSTPVSREEATNILRNSRAKLADIQEVHIAVKARCPDNYQTTGMIVDTDLYEVTYTISTGGAPFPGLEDAIAGLNNMGADIYVASGDSMRSLSYLLEFGIKYDKIYPVANPQKKRNIVMDLKKRYKSVVMVGDGLNDIYALDAADIGVLTVQQDTGPSTELVEAADRIINDIRDLPSLISEIE
jgi:soluble P-type ATPase